MSAPVAAVAAHAISLLQAPAHWRRIDFIADLHLQDCDDGNFGAWKDFMESTPADAVFILGDLFEVWVGDDVIDDPLATDFAARCARVLAEAAKRLSVYFMHGNRDFLLGPAYASACAMKLLDDPTLLEFAGQRCLLSHGDALCLQDHDYMAFRAQVRNARWRQAFLSQPLVQRQAVGREMRSQSEAYKRMGAAGHDKLVDLDLAGSCEWLRTAVATTLIHGHTHRPGEHQLQDGYRRIVLSDWDVGATPARCSVLRLSATDKLSDQPSVVFERLSLPLSKRRSRRFATDPETARRRS